MKKLHLIAIFTVLAFSVLSHASESSKPVTPIFISVDSKSTNSEGIIINDRPLGLGEPRDWFRSTSEKFGRKDPIIIQIRKMEDFSPMRKVAGMAHI